MCRLSNRNHSRFKHDADRHVIQLSTTSVFQNMKHIRRDCRCNMVCWTRLPTSLVLLIASIITSTDAATYDEHLLLRPLPQSSLLGSFNFRSSIPETSFRAQNFQTFPRSLGQILLHSHTDELHLRFSTGRWDSETWGDRPWNGSREGGTGVELWAWMRGDDEAGCVRF
jgi:hypothetical protein